MVSANHIPRKTAFRRALEDAGSSISAWAVRNGVSRTHLYMVLDGERTPSATLDKKIADVLKEQRAA